MSRLTAVVLAMAACTPAQVPHARDTAKIGAEVAALAGVGGLISAGVGERETSTNFVPLGVAAAVVSAAGIVGWALLELQYGGPDEPAAETLEQRNRRWAKILTERASGAARENKCARVKRLEARVHAYDAEIHDFVFMRDPEIVRCLGEP